MVRHARNHALTCMFNLRTHIRLGVRVRVRVRVRNPTSRYAMYVCMAECAIMRTYRKEPNMAASKNLVVKVTSTKVNVYTDMPEGVVRPSLYTKLDKAQSKEVRSILADDARLLNDLNTKGAAYLGSRNKSGLKPRLRAVVAGTKQPKAVEAPAKQVQNKAPKGIPTTKNGQPDKRYKAAKQAVPAAKQEGESFDYAAMAAYADAIEKLTNAGFTKDEAKTMAAALR